jgi:hypothetical protein
MADVSIADRTAQAGVAKASPKAHRNLSLGNLSLAWLISGVAMVAVLMAPALWNGFPIIFPDTGGYLTRPIEGALTIGRSALYGAFLYTGIPFDFWPNAIAQSALTVWLIVLTLRTNGLGGRPWLALGIVTMLGVGTSLPWFAGQLMPDIFFSAAVLALYLLVFRSEQLARWEIVALAVTIALAVPSHMAAAGMCAGIVVALLLLSRVKQLALPKMRLWLAAGSVLAGIALCPVSNYAITGKLAFTPGGSSFLFGRLIEDGIVARYLAEQCPDATLRLCVYKNDMPDNADDWLWGDNVFNRLGGWQGWEPEENRIIKATLERYPFDHLATAVTGTLKQFFSFQTEISKENNEPTIGTLADRTPQLYPRFMKARQQAESFDMSPLNWLHLPVAALAVAGLGGALLARRRLDIAPEAAALCVTILLALAANAAICGIFSHPVDRYQSRLVLLAPFGVALMIAQRRAARPAGSRDPLLGPAADMA